jgi:serine phosphatase RsbU (regulator of sigma subunit)
MSRIVIAITDGATRGRELSPAQPPLAPSYAARCVQEMTFEQSEEPRRVLLVEDDDGDALIVEDLLIDAWPSLVIDRVRRVHDAEDAIGPQIDCVLLDLGLPDASGLDAVRRVRAIDSEMPVVVLTGDADELRGVRALAAGAQDYLVKGAINGVGLSRAIRHSVQRKLAERSQRELAILRVQTAENARIQRGLLPQPIIDDRHIRVSSAYRPGNRRQLLGGDFFDVVQSEPGRLHAVLGDVSGHGPDEAALGVRLRIAWRTLILSQAPADQIFDTLDRVLAQERHAEHIFTTLASLSVDLEAGRADVRLAGHPPPILVSGRHWQLMGAGSGGPPLGLVDDGAWPAHEVEIGSSWSLLMYSDGIYEGRIPDRSERLGIEGLLELLSAAQGAMLDSPEQLIERVEELNGGPLDDDVALMSLTRDAGG